MRDECKYHYPLLWPDGWVRRSSGRRKPDPFRVSRYRATRELLAELRRLGAIKVILSSDVPLKKNGEPYGGDPEPADPGVAVWFQHGGQTRVIACDAYKTLTGNVRAVGLTVNALRAVQRHGATELLDRAFAGFKALPAAGPPWHVALGVPEDAGADAVLAGYRRRVLETHPDRGGSAEEFAKVQAAWDEARRLGRVAGVSLNGNIS
jgi:hypothetical protein